MKIKDILKKVLAGEELNALDKAELEQFDPGKDAAALAQAQMELAELKKKQEEAESAKLTETEKLTKRAEKAEADLAKKTKELADAEAAHSATKAEFGRLQRSTRIAKLAAESGCTDPDYLDFMATKKGVDLDKEDAVKPFLDELKSSSPASFKAEIKPGTGDPPPADTKTGDPDPRDRIGGIAKLVAEAPESK